MIFIFFYHAFAENIITGIQTSTINVGSLQSYTFIDCLFQISGIAIEIDGDNSTVNCIYTTFICPNSGSYGKAIENENRPCDLNLKFVCIADYYSFFHGSAYYFNVEYEPSNAVFSYMTVKNCNSDERVIYTVGNRDSNMAYTNCNFTQCAQYSPNENGVFLFCDYNTNIKYSTFEGNEGENYIISYELSGYTVDPTLITGVTDKCNIVNNSFSESSLILVTLQHYTIENTIIKDNIGNGNVFGTLYSGNLTLNNCVIQQFNTAGIEVIDCIIGSEENYSTYRLRFYQTNECYAELPYSPKKLRTVNYKPMKLAHFIRSKDS